MTQANPSFGYLMKVCIGLCNRMRVIASAYQLIRPQGGKLVVKWSSNGELNRPAKALFSLPRGIRVVDVTGGDNSNPRRRQARGGGLVFGFTGSPADRLPHPR